MSKLIWILTVCFLLSACGSNQPSEVNEETQEAVAVLPSDSKAVIEEKTIIPELYVVKYASIQTGEHNSSAEIDINNDNTVILNEFYYDGKAPDVYIALGNFDENGEFVKGEIVSPLIEGVYKGEEYRFTLSSDIDFDSYTAISIYCNRYSEDFASAQLIDIE